MEQWHLKDKVAIITGGGQGIGRQIGRSLCQAGCRVIIADLDEEAGLENVNFIQSQKGIAHFVKTDVSKVESIKNMVQKAIELYGRIDILINNAGIFKHVDVLAENAIEAFDQVMSVNIRGTFVCSKLVAEVMAKQHKEDPLNKGCIVNIASTRAEMSEPNTEGYSASKGGIVSLTHSMAISLAPYIRVNCISPGWIDVRSMQKETSVDTTPLSVADHKQHPVGRVGEARDIANACLFLASNEMSGFITGQNIAIDGGMTKKMIYV